MSNSTRLKEVLAIVNNKGGVGKTTTVQSLAAALVRQHHNYRILVVDLDPQGHLSPLHGWNPQEHQNDRTVYDALRRGQALPLSKFPGAAGGGQRPLQTGDQSEDGTGEVFWTGSR